MRFSSLRSTHPSLPWLRVLGKLALVLVALCFFVSGFSPAAAKPRVWDVQGTFQTQVQAPETCPAPYTLCSSGTVTGQLEGTVFVVIESSTFEIDANGLPVSRYSGSITISTTRGDLTGRVDGQVRLTDGALSSVVTLTEGTRGYHATTGTLQVTGQFNLGTGTEFDQFAGTLVRE